MYNRFLSYNRFKIREECLIVLLYIIKHNKYLEHYRSGLMKYIPYGLLPNIKPKIIDDIVRKDDIIGKVVGINLKPIDYSCEKSLEEYIIGIKRLGIEDINSLYLEEMEYVPRTVIKYMEDSLGLKISRNQDIKIFHIPLVIKKIYNLLEYDLQDKEILIISEDKEISKTIIREIAKDIKFITNLGCSLTDSEEIYEYILEETGLSLFHSSDISKIWGRYSIVINLSEDFKLEVSKIKRNAIIFDFGSRKNLDSNRKDNLLHSIKDFGFKLEDININRNKWLGDWIRSDLYGALDGILPGEIKILYLEKDYYHIEDYVNSFIKLKGML